MQWQGNEELERSLVVTSWKVCNEMPTKVKELNNRKEGDRRQCPICNHNFKKRGRITMSELWEWSMRNPELKPFRSQSA